MAKVQFQGDGEAIHSLLWESADKGYVWKFLKKYNILALKVSQEFLNFSLYISQNYIPLSLYLPYKLYIKGGWTNDLCNDKKWSK